MHRLVPGSFVIAVLLAAPLRAQVPPPTAAPPAAEAPGPPNDYTKDDAWLCRPGRRDACDIDHTTTVIAADGTMTAERWTADPTAPVDCFYVYPTISTDTTTNSDMTADPAELNVVKQQFARFASVCRPFAPLYRQITLAGLRQRMSGQGFGLGGGLAYDDVRDAWNDYLKRDNRGRGVVLIGHSQGSFILTSLIRNEIDGKPVQQRLVSAILMGSTVEVPKGRDVGGAFAEVPVCRSAAQVGCVIAFASFRATAPPPADTLFGHARGDGAVAVCVNPATFDGGSGDLHAYLDATGQTIVSRPALAPWVATEGAAVATPWVSVPGLLTARCASNEHAQYLEITVHGDPADPRVDDITGDIGTPARRAVNWGLHLVDVNLTMGNLIDVVRQQGRTWQAKH
ncbi:MAG: DUF3089 domain-containing protein [Vicinamibacterales bacterium]